MSSTSLTPEPAALTHASWLSLEIVKPANSPHRLFPEVPLTKEWAAKDGKTRHCGTIRCRRATVSGALVVNSMLKMVPCLGGNPPPTPTGEPAMVFISMTPSWAFMVTLVSATLASRASTPVKSVCPLWERWILDTRIAMADAAAQRIRMELMMRTWWKLIVEGLLLIGWSWIAWELIHATDKLTLRHWAVTMELFVLIVTQLEPMVTEAVLILGLLHPSGLKKVLNVRVTGCQCIALFICMLLKS